DLLNDVAHLHVVKNPAIGIARQCPELGHDLQLVPRHVAVFPSTGKVAHNAVEVPLRVVELGDVDRDILADDLREVDRRVFRQSRQVKLKQTRYGLAAGEAGKQQL